MEDVIACAERTASGNVSHNLPSILYNLRHVRQSMSVKLEGAKCPDCGGTKHVIDKVFATCEDCHHRWYIEA